MPSIKETIEDMVQVYQIINAETHEPIYLPSPGASYPKKSIFTDYFTCCKFLEVLKHKYPQATFIKQDLYVSRGRYNELKKNRY